MEGSSTNPMNSRLRPRNVGGGSSSNRLDSSAEEEEPRLGRLGGEGSGRGGLDDPLLLPLSHHYPRQRYYRPLQNSRRMSLSSSSTKSYLRQLLALALLLLPGLFVMVPDAGTLSGSNAFSSGRWTSVAGSVFSYGDEVSPSRTTTPAVVKLPFASRGRGSFVGRGAAPAPPLLKSGTAASESDYGGLEFRPVLADYNYTRTIHDDDDEIYSTRRKRFLQRLDETTTSDDVDSRTPNRFEHYEEITYPTADGCYLPKWSYEIYPSCPRFHELSVDRGIGYADQRVDVNYLARGHFRESWLLTNERGHDEGVLKTNRMYERRHYKNYAFKQTAMEAISMLEIFSLNTTMDIYGFCGTSVMVEPGLEPIYYSVIGNEKFVGPNGVKEEEARELVTYNQYTPEEKLDIATAMAEAVASLHGNPRGALVSHDLGFDQFLVSKNDGRLKLNDFNKNYALAWDREHGRYCPFYSHQSDIYRAPQEMNGGYIDESGDVLTLGKLLFNLLSGRTPYYNKVNSKQAKKAVINGEEPYVDPRYRTRSFIEGRLVEIMSRCWKYEPGDRPTAFEVVNYLRETARLARAGTAAAATEQQ